LSQASIRSSAVIGEALGRALESGDFEPLAELYTKDALFDASLPARRVRLTGRAPIRTQLEQWWSTPGRLRRFDVTSFPSGLTVEFERSWREDGERLWRQRHFLQMREGQIVRHQIYCARPQGRAAAAASPLVERAIAKLEGEVVARARRSVGKHARAGPSRRRFPACRQGGDGGGGLDLACHARPLP
jgi:hypothetical protein